MTRTVEELIELLQEYSGSLPVYVGHNVQDAVKVELVDFEDGPGIVID